MDGTLELGFRDYFYTNTVEEETTTNEYGVRGSFTTVLGLYFNK
jgi:hypothetical protein